MKLLAENGPTDIHAIMEHINNVMRNGTTTNQLGNVLSRDKRFVVCGMTRVDSMLSGSHEITVWDLKEEVLAEIDCECITTDMGGKCTHCLRGPRSFAERLPGILEKEVRRP